MGFFEFQVQRPATFIPDSTHPHPSLRQDTSHTLIQFLVDTSGVPIASTLRVLRVKPAIPINVAELRTLLPKWRFTPAKLDGCSVQQLVQTSIDP